MAQRTPSPSGRRPQQARRPQQNRRSQQPARRPPQQARRAPAHARPQAVPPRRRSAVPVVVALLGVVFVALLGVFVVRSCTGGGVSLPLPFGGGAPSEQQEGAAPDAETDADTAAQAAADDGSVDINLMMVGDILFHYQVRMSGLQQDGSRNYDHLFAHVLGELEGQDIKVLNQETPLGGPVYEGSAPDGYDGYPEFNGPQEVGDAEAKAGFNVVLKATNHAMDNSGLFDDPYTLVRSEQSFWRTQHPEITVLGEAFVDDEDSTTNDVYVYEKDGFTVALLNFTQDLNGNEPHDTLGVVSMLEEEHVRTVMAKAHELADMVVVFPHWGEEYSVEPVEEQREWASFLVEQGADVIIGNHPHVIEPVELLISAEGKGVPCFWSTGNFVSTSPSDESLVGGMAKVTLHKDADGTCSVAAASFVPLVTHLGLSTDMTTYLLSDWTDELAATNVLYTDINQADNTGLTPAWANEFCTQVLGAGFDTATERFTLEL